VARHQDRPAVAALEGAGPRRQLQARLLFLVGVTFAAAVDQDRPDLQLEELPAGLGARGRDQRAKAQGHGDADQLPSHWDSSCRLSHGEYPNSAASGTHVREYTARAAL